MYMKENNPSRSYRRYLLVIVAVMFFVAMVFGIGTFMASAADTSYNDLTLGTTEQSTVAYRDYWYINVAKDNSFVDLTTTGDKVEVSLYYGKVTTPGRYLPGGRLEGPGSKRYFVEEAGTYSIEVYGINKSYTVTATASQINWGKTTVTGLDKFARGDKNKAFTINISGATEGVQISYIKVNNSNFNFGYESFSYGQAGTSYSGTISAENGGLYPGKYKFQVTLTWYDEDGTSYTGTTANVEIPFNLYPMALNLTKGRIVTTYNTAALTYQGQIAQNGPTLKLQIQENGKWLTKKTIKTQSDTTSDYVIKGLKSNTAYTFRVVSVSSDGLENAGSSITVKTGVAKKPSIKSIKFSKIKQNYVAKHWVSGSMSANGWILGHWASASWTTYANIKITFKSKLPGTVGYIVTCDGASQTVYTKGKTITLKHFAISGKKKGKKATFSIVAIRDKDYKGSSMTASKKAKVK